MSYNTLAGDVPSPYAVVKQCTTRYLRNADDTSAESTPQICVAPFLFALV